MESALRLVEFILQLHWHTFGNTFDNGKSKKAEFSVTYYHSDSVIWQHYIIIISDSQMKKWLQYCWNKMKKSWKQKTFLNSTIQILRKYISLRWKMNFSIEILAFQNRNEMWSGTFYCTIIWLKIAFSVWCEWFFHCGSESQGYSNLST